jgi:tetraacyldisaccharide 4'-kinase
VPAPVFFSACEPYGYLVPAGSICVTEAAVCEPLGAPGISAICRRRALAFSGIARNDDFHRTLRHQRIDIAAVRSFPDHHAYTLQETSGIVTAARDAGADLLVTTDKDHARIDRVVWPLDLLVLGVGIVFGQDEEAFDAFIGERVGGGGAARPNSQG